jgi:acetoin utilization protein AcuB
MTTKKSSSRSTIAEVMTRTPHTIGRDQTLTAAHETMRAHGVRHLPVLDAGKVVGVLTQRDLYFIETLKGIDADTVKVEEAMAQDVYSVPTDAPLVDVAERMGERKYGCVVVTEKGKPVGLFTTIDALRVLVSLLRARP